MLIKLKNLHFAYVGSQSFLSDFYDIVSMSLFTERIDDEKSLEDNKDVFRRYIIQGANGLVPELNFSWSFIFHLREPDFIKAKRISDMIGGLYINHSNFTHYEKSDAKPFDFDNADEYLERVRGIRIDSYRQIKKMELSNFDTFRLLGVWKQQIWQVNLH